MAKIYSISNVFVQVRKHFKTHSSMLDDVVKRAESKANDVHEMISYLEKTGQNKGLLAKWLEGHQVETAQGYIKSIKNDAFNLAVDLHRVACESKEIHQKLQEVERTFQNGVDVAADFIIKRRKDADIPNASVHLGYLSNVIDRFEMKPRAPVIPIRPGIQIDR